MRIGDAMRTAVRDFYEQSWRFVVLNSLLSVAVLSLLVAASYTRSALALALLLGPLAAALMHCAVRVVHEEELSLRCAVEGLRLQWRRGLELSLIAILVFLAGTIAIRSYAGAGSFGWPLAFLVAYVLALFVVFQVQLWPIAIDERERPLREVLRKSGFALARRPLSSIVLAFFLLLVNALGAAAAVLPLLTLTVAYSFLAAARFALPDDPILEAGS
ncbi:MAG: hypothetical protein MSC30_02020 [Gaiellaceae bacterium MAG52_C11]|nr:hypothetical protein [Candidatus Gaiellasilicea maunaloa]